MAGLDIPLEEDGQLIVSRRITEGRSLCKLNGVTATLSMVRQATGLLIDIHGQHEHQSLLQKAKHLAILDEFTKNQTGALRKELARSYEQYAALKKEADSFTLDEEGRRRELDFCRYEIQEIENARLRPGEEEELSTRYRRMANARKIVEGMNRVYQAVDGDTEGSAGAGIGLAVREIAQIADFDEEIADMQEQLFQVDNLLSDLGRQISDYMEEMSFDPQELGSGAQPAGEIRGFL